MMARLSDYGALSFDCYGTLVDWEAGLWSTLEPWLAAANKGVSRREALAAFAKHETLQEETTPELAYSKVLEQVHLRLAREWGIPEDAGRARAFAESIGSWEPFPDTGPALRRLKERHRLFVLSNVDERSFAATAPKLGVVLDGVFTAEAIGSYKPSRRNFEYLLARAREHGIARERLLHCAQSLFHDVLPASELGIATCWIDRGAGTGGFGATPPPARPPTATFQFGSLRELVEAMDAEPRARTTRRGDLP
jgi:2-haloalkanoic acid dehalogenase type II